MPQKEVVLTANAPAPLPFLSQAIKCQGMVYCSGAVGMDPKTMKIVEGNVVDRLVRFEFPQPYYTPSIYKRKKTKTQPLTR